MSDTPSGEASTVLSCRGLTKSFEEGAQRLEVLRGIDMDIARGERLAIVGASGSGKTTLLQLLGGLDAPTSGSVSILGEDLSGLSEDQRGRLRNRAIGFVYQFHHLLPEFSALENVAMPLLVRREPARPALRGRASAGGRRPGPDNAARAGPRGRADRQSRSPYRRAGLRRHARPQPRARHEPGRRHP